MSALIFIFLGALAVLFLGVGKLEKVVKPMAILTLLGGLALTGVEWYGKIEKGLGHLKSGLLFNWLNWTEIEGTRMMLDFDLFISYSMVSIMIVACLFIVALFKSEQFKGGDLLGLMLFSLCGGIILASYTSFVMMFLGIEILSIPLYVLAGSLKHDKRSNEAAMKYFIMGALSTAIFLLGVAFLYGSSKGALDLPSLLTSFGKETPGLTKAGILIMLAAMLFKMGAVPFHYWSPDVYEGSPSRVTAFMSTVAKVAAFVAFFRLIYIGIGNVFSVWILLLAIFAALSILIGNIGAYAQKTAKRVLAYSSIAHVGYFLINYLMFSDTMTQISAFKGIGAAVAYSFAYAMGSLLVFFVIHQIEIAQKRSVLVTDFAGLFKRNRLLGIGLTIGLMSLAGIPLTAGFAGKLQVFTAGWGKYWWVIIVGLIGSAISIAYYFRFIKYAVSTDSESNEQAPISLSFGTKFWYILAIVLVILIGILPWILQLPLDYYMEQVMKMQSTHLPAH